MSQISYGGSDTVQTPNVSHGFYGATPIAKPAVTQQSTATTTALRADINRLETALVNLGLISVT